ncbi:hypothetical protein KC947_03200 [Candidatus Saccharibacteria bacterium]|nr:hypothetical protein [Candidatus Saccharibacteria bacterium]
MLEFLVLGHIPGTNLEITLFWYLLVGLALSISVLAFYHKTHSTKRRNKEATQLQLFS